MQPPTLELPQKVTDYINEHSPLPPITDPDEPLRMDSLAVLRLVAWLEQEFGVQIEDEEVVAENFATLRTLAQLIRPKLGATGP
jgi:acyl carrier protein